MAAAGCGRSRSRAAALIVLAAISIALAAGVSIQHALLLGLALAGGFVLLWLALRLLRRLLWRVGRRLAFTYFLIGVLPIPMAAFLLAVAAYLLGGFFLGHLFRDALAVVEQEVVAAAETRLEDPASFAGAPAQRGRRRVLVLRRRSAGGGGRAGTGAVAELAGGRARRVPAASAAAAGGDAAAPVAPHRARRRPPARRTRPLVALPDGTVTLAVARSRGPSGVVAFHDGPLDARLRALSGVWIELLPTGDPSADRVMDVTILGQRFLFQPLSRERGAEDRVKFLGGAGHRLSGWPVGEAASGSTASTSPGRLISLDTGEEIAASLPASLVGTPEGSCPGSSRARARSTRWPGSPSWSRRSSSSTSSRWPGSWPCS